MLLSDPPRVAHRGALLCFMAALVAVMAPIARAETPAQRQELAGALRQLGSLEHAVAHSATPTPITPGERYYFDYPRLLADLARVRAGIQDYLAPSRAQPRDPAELAGDYRDERTVEPQAPLPPTTAVESRR